MDTVLEDASTGRLPLPQERELWRIAQEAVTNAERHSGGRTVWVRWRCDGSHARLEVADDGVGFETRKAGRMDSYGILGMRERAAGIGATLSVDSTPGRGTTVRCALAP
jgi:signal transduction histidine kinase